MNKFFLFFLTLLFLIAIPFVSASYETVTIDGVTFDIPGQFQDGRTIEDGYIFDNNNVFSIHSLETSLDNVYGYRMSNAENENMTIESHEVVYCFKYNPSSETNNSAVFFACGDIIYVIAFEGNTIPDYIREMIANSPDSTLSSEEFYSTLDDALTQYQMGEMVDDYVDSYHYYTHSSSDKSSGMHYVYFPRYF